MTTQLEATSITTEAVVEAPAPAPQPLAETLHHEKSGGLMQIA